MKQTESQKTYICMNLKKSCLVINVFYVPIIIKPYVNHIYEKTGLKIKAGFDT